MILERPSVNLVHPHAEGEAAMADVIRPGPAHGLSEAHLASPPPAGNTTLVPSLSLFDATAMSVGAIIGAGIFVVVGIAATQAGSALIVSIVIAALMALLSALSITELIRWLPTEGSSYEIARRLLSPATGFLAGWMYIINNTFTGAAVAIGFAHSLRILIPAVPVAWSASLLCLVFTALNSVGIRQSARLNNVLESSGSWPFSRSSARSVSVTLTWRISRPLSPFDGVSSRGRVPCSSRLAALPGWR
jgi:amino acid permease-like protein